MCQFSDVITTNPRSGRVVDTVVKLLVKGCGSPTYPMANG